jgi:hypothetical protein
MANIYSALYVRLSGFAGLAALVGKRIYPPIVLLTPVYPLVYYQLIGGHPNYVMGGQSGLALAKFQIDSWALTTAPARDVAEQIRLALSGYHGTSDGINIDLTEMTKWHDLYNDSNDLHGVSQDYNIHFRETPP